MKDLENFPQGVLANTTEELLYSVAVSLKRLADAVERIREDTEQLRAGMGYINRNWFERGGSK